MTFDKAILTEKGNELLVDAASGKQIEFTRLVTGCGIYNESEELINVTALREQRQEFDFSEIEKVNESSVLLKAVISNINLEAGYHITEIGIYMKLQGTDNEVLYSINIVNANDADFLPPYNGLVSIEISLSCYITIKQDARPKVAVGDAIDILLNEIDEERARATKAEMTNSDAIAAEVERAKEQEALKAPIASPTFTGTPKAPTATAGTNSTQIATTSFAQIAISNHNTSSASHDDIRNLITGLSNRLNALADSDDTTLDQLSEIVTYIKNNKTLIDSITASKVNVSDIVNNLTSTAANKPLSAKQGEVLKSLIDVLTTTVEDKVDKISGKGLSTNDYTTQEKSKLSGIAEGAEVNVQADWNVTDTNSDAYIKNKPTSLPANGGTATKLKTARSVDGVGFDGSAAITHYGTCSTAAATAAKTVDCTGFALATGATIKVKFTVTNTAANPTLNVNSTGAKAIYYRGAAITAAYLAANRTYEFVYNGTQYELVGDIDTNSTYSASATTPKAAGTAAVGTESGYARGDHVHPAQTTVTGNAGTATKLKTARSVDGVGFDGSAAITHYGTCSTAAATAAKTVDCTGFALATGATIKVKFTVTNTAANPTLNVNSTGAKAIYYRGAAITAAYLAANRTYEFVYNGTQYELVGDIDTNSTYSAMTGATASAAGKSGLVTAPAKGKQTAFLRGDATWVTPSTSLAGTEQGIPADQTAVKALNDKIEEQNTDLANRIVTLYKNPDPFSNYATSAKNPSGSPFIVTLSDTANNYEQLLITCGMIITNSDGQKWAPTTHTVIYTDCKTEHLYERFISAVNTGGDDAVIQINMNRVTKKMEVVVFSTHSSNVVGFFIKTVKGIRF